MAKIKKQLCGLKGCGKVLGPGAAEVGYEQDGKTKKVRVCSEHAWMIMTAPRGTWRINEKCELVPIPAKPTIIT
jgi:hypothetical protein